MASSMLQLISKKLVKPSIPTPPSLRNHKLCLMDQLFETMYVPMAFFYPNQHHHKQPADNTSSQISSVLEESLSKTLSYYYPFAGRVTDNLFVNCNDTGAPFLEARIGCKMSEFLQGANDAIAQDIVFPSGLIWRTGRDHQANPVTAQINHFDCGGKALGVVINHKVADGNTICNFISDWAAMARQSSTKPSPQFTASSILPPIDDPSTEEVIEMKKGKNLISRRFVFDAEKLNQLKAKATAEEGVQKPTRVEVVSALLYKSAMSASMVHSGSFKPSFLTSIVNLRPLLGVSETYAGNLMSAFNVVITDEKETNFSRIVREIRREKVQYFEKYKGIKKNDLVSAIIENGEQAMALQGKNDVEGYNCSSLSRFPVYKIDFGWGKPIKAGLAACPIKNFFILMESHNAGNIEAMVALDEKAMSVFETDPELLAFASRSSF